jgi:hypothetical protein
MRAAWRAPVQIVPLQTRENAYRVIDYHAYNRHLGDVFMREKRDAP